MAKLANRLTASKKKKIHSLFYKQSLTIPEIAELENVTYWQVYRIINGQTKLDGSPRRDKGKSRSSVDESGNIDSVDSKWSLGDFKDLDDFQLFLLMDTLQDVAVMNMSPGEKVKIVKDIEVIQTKIAARQLKNNIRRPDAEVIARIIRRFKPKVTNQEIVQIYKEELEMWQRSKDG